MSYYRPVTGFITLCLLLFSVHSLRSDGHVSIPGNGWGVYQWGAWNEKILNRTTVPGLRGISQVLKWSELQPSRGEFAFDEHIGSLLKKADENDYHVMIMIWVAPANHSPQWLYDNGVPMVTCEKTINPRREERIWTGPYYMDENYQRFFFAMIDELGRYLAGLPEGLRRRVQFIQSAEGSTGDGQPYKGAPLNPEFSIDENEWGNFRVAVWRAYKEALKGSGIPLLVNFDANRESDYDWLIDNFEVFGLKFGMFSHGYHISDSAERIKQWNEVYERARARGQTIFTRGEQDGEWKICNWSRKNPKQAFYWSGIFAIHCGLDLWNVPKDALLAKLSDDGVSFFNRYAGQRDPKKSPYAFCALRKGLDASDAEAYPSSVYGSVDKKNMDRYLKIAKAHARYGAIQGDPKKAMFGGMQNRQRDDYNDVGWGIVRGNYERFLTQLRPDETSQAYWHVLNGKSVYSRFARGFDHANGKNAMYFRLHDDFYADDVTARSVRLKVIYLDDGTGSWSLSVNTKRGVQKLIRQNCGATGEWKEVIVEVQDALFDGKLRDASDIMLSHEDGTDTVFHMIELERIEGSR